MNVHFAPPNVAMCPNGVVQWGLTTARLGKLFVSPSVSTEALDILRELGRSGHLGRSCHHLNSGGYADTLRIGDIVVKEFTENLAPVAGLGAMQANVMLETGAKDATTIIRGKKIGLATPLNFGMFIPDDLEIPISWVMSYVPGREISCISPDVHVPDSTVRMQMYTKAIQAVGGDTRGIDFDDADHNLLFRDASPLSGVDYELVKLDLSVERERMCTYETALF